VDVNGATFREPKKKPAGIGFVIGICFYNVVLQENGKDFFD
jgi:hypothetical protein